MEKYFTGGFLYRASDESVLLHFRDGNTSVNPWSFAFFGWGSEEIDSTPKDAFMREFREETGITLDSTRVLLLAEYVNTTHGMMRHVFYSEQAIPVETIVLGEGAGFAWIPLNKLGQFPLTEKTVNDLKLFQKILVSKCHWLKI